MPETPKKKPEPDPKKVETKTTRTPAKDGVAAAVSAEVSVASRGRPLPTDTTEHGYKDDYKPRNYKTLGDPQPKDKVNLPRLEDDNVDWQTFHFPKNIPHGGPQWWVNASPSEKRAAWEEATAGEVEPEDHGDLSKVRRRLHDLMQTLPIHFSILIAEIRHKRDVVRFRRRKIRERMVEEDDESRAKGAVKRNKDGSVADDGCCNRCGVHASLAASIIHYSACFHVGLMIIAVMVQQWFEIQELHQLFPSSPFENPVTRRLLGVIGLILVLAAMILGMVGHFYKSNFLLRLYVVMFLLGAGLYGYQSWTENYYAEGDGLGPVLKEQVKDYLKNKGKHATFLFQSQKKFRCCGDKGPKDYESLKSSLPSSCCGTSSSNCHLGSDSVHSRGCTATVKTFLGHLYSLRLYTTPFLLFGSVVGIIAAINLDRYQTFICSCCKRKKAAPLKKTKYAKQVLFRKTEAETLLDDIEEATTSMVRPNRSKFEFENDSVHGTLAYVRRKLSECETITDFILAVVNLLHEVEAFQESELGAKRPDPEVIARVILGFRPKRFVTPSLIDYDFERILHDAQFDHKLRSELGRKDLAIRMNMQEILEDQSQLLSRKEEHLEHHNLMGFPLPRPINGMRVSEWRRMSGPNDSKRVTRRDKYTIYEDDYLDPLDSAYLEEDRILHLAAPAGESSKLSQLCHKYFPYFSEITVQEYLFLEDAMYAPILEVFSKIIAEAQGILFDIHRKARFRKFSISGNLEPPAPTKSRTKSISQASEIDVLKVNDCLKLLIESEAMREQKMQRWIRKQTEIANLAP